MFGNLNAFEGIWDIDRRITPAAGQGATLTGQAVFTPDAEGLLYREDGWLCIEGQSPLKAERRYRWRAGSGLCIDVAFEDGRAFHVIDPDQPAARHHCAPDVYDVEYDFSGWPYWHSVWCVSGPQKKYRMETRYSRPVRKT